MYCTAESDRVVDRDGEMVPFGMAPDPSGESRRIRALQLTSALTQHLDVGALAQCFATELARYVPHRGLALSIPPLEMAHRIGQRARHRLHYRLVLADEELGTLEISHDRPFGAEAVREIDDLTGSLIYPLRNAVLFQTALHLVYRDPLTGLNNRAALDLTLAHELELSSRQGTPVSLLIMDTDNFKQINDSHGHAVGDRVMREIADALSRSVRRTDLIHRYGGDEFVVVLANTDAAGAVCVAERIRAAIDALRIAEGNVHLMVSVSVGLAERRPGEDLAGLFQRADAALYRAKGAGRNQVVAG